nr:unnamed protein product [Callosobruchus chinensis]
MKLCGDYSYSSGTKEFSDGREKVKNKIHARRPKTSVTEANIEAVRNLMEANRRINFSEIVDKLNISYVSVY